MARSTITVDVELRALVDGSEIPFEWLLEAIKEKRERETNPPLTEEQIRGRLDKSIPTWVENIDHKDDNLTFSGWAELSQPSCYKDSFCVWWFGSDVEDYLKWDNLGVTFNLYAHEPKHEQE